ncbi:MAG: relaxase/mobilization nuclease domain-containing protein [Pseudomonadota bacterium]
MIVVANPSGRSGQSFKGLHAYCAHDPDRAESTERVDWISTRNLCSDPERAWKEMVATAMMADQLKAAAGVRSGRKATKGPVLHLVLSFDKDEDTSREAMEAAADKALAALGADPAKMRGKSKPSRRQFADEHQAIFYAHSDTRNTHLHVMLNTVHPEHGTRLPTSNNFNKLQSWALEHTRAAGTAENYPVRQENAEARERGEYVKGPKRTTRNMWELQGAVREPINDNSRAESILAQQRAKDAALLKRSRALAVRQKAERSALDDGFRETKAKLAERLKTDLNRDRAAISEDFRPQFRALKAKQEQERRVFDALETSVFGRASNMAKALRTSLEDVREGENGGAMSRAFRILTRASERKAVFERKLDREIRGLKADQRQQLAEAKSARTEAHTTALQARREQYLERSTAMRERHEAERADIKSAWNERSQERQAFVRGKVDAEPMRRDVMHQHRRSAMNKTLMDRMRALDASGQLNRDFNAGRDPAREQDNDKDRER